MFHTLITLAYIIPNIYVFFRIRHLFINRGFRIRYTIIYILFALIYPVSNIISEDGAGFPAHFLSVSSGYVLPFYLYLFLSVLVFDIFLLFNYLFKITPAGNFKSLRFKVYALSAIVLFSIMVVVAGIINFNTIRTSEYKIDVPARSSELSHLRIAFAADFHLKKDVNVKFVERFVKKIEIIDPDLMIFGGDMVEGDRNDGNLLVFEQLLSGIKARYGVFGVLGNHEHYAGREKGGFFERSGIKILSDTTIILNNAFSLTGRNDSHIQTRKQLSELLKSVTDSLPLILVDHRPTEIDLVSKTSADVQLSGHTHNGQLFPISLITKKIYILSWGYKKIGNTHFFVTSGIRLWGPPVRTTGKSEIMVIDINFIRK